MTDPATGSIDAELEAAVAHLVRGELVAMPTETVYGLAADAGNPDAISKIYAAKQRPAGHPLIVHVAPGADLSYWAKSVPAAALCLADAFWPGPLTLILPKAAHIPDTVSGGLDTIGLRCPSHPVASELLARFAKTKPNGQGGLAAPSANKFGQVSPTKAAHVRQEFPELADKALLILDGGPAEVGIESTIVDVSMPDGAAPALLRPGAITAAQIEAVLKQPLARPGRDSPQVSGSLKAHYAPRTPLKVLPRHELEAWLVRQACHTGKSAAVVMFEPVASRDLPLAHVHVCDADPRRYAHELYAMLRHLDEQGYDMLLVEQPPQDPEWSAINDRLSRAAAAFVR